MNEWDSMEEIEPLDEGSMGLLASYREARGPSEAAEARMLAGLRTRLAAETETEPEPAAAVRASARPEVRPETGQSRVRTFAVAAVAFAAGVALTLSISAGQKDASAPSEPDHVAGGRSARPEFSPAGPRLETPHALDEPTYVPAVPESHPPADARPWPLSVADLAKVPDDRDDHDRDRDEIDDDGLPQSVELPPSSIDDDDDVTATARRRRVLSPDEDSLAQHGSRSGPDPRGSAIAGGSSVGAWAPSLSPSPASAGLGAAARNAAVGGAPSPSNGASPGGQNGGGKSNGNGNDAPSGDTPPSGDPAPSSDEPPPPDDPPPEDDSRDEEPGDEDLPAQCESEHEACQADAAAYCAWNPEGCGFVMDFCHERLMTCMGSEPFMPEPEDPMEPDPADCETQYDMCMMDLESMCVLEKAPPEVCYEFDLQCEDMLAECEGVPPPEAPW